MIDVITISEIVSYLHLILFREVYITYVPPVTEVAALEKEIRGICKFDTDQDFTIKWIDEEGKMLMAGILTSCDAWYCTNFQSVLLICRLVIS